MGYGHTRSYIGERYGNSARDGGGGARGGGEDRGAKDRGSWRYTLPSDG